MLESSTHAPCSRLPVTQCGSNLTTTPYQGGRFLGKFHPIPVLFHPIPGIFSARLVVLQSDDGQLRLTDTRRSRKAPASSRATKASAFALRGFTLLEMLVVLVIIGLLTGYVAPRFFAQIGRSEVKVAAAQIEAFSKALDQYRLDMGRYPTTEQGLAALSTAPDKSPRWHGPYLRKSVPKDPWGNDYAYFAPGKQGEYEIIAYGRDGKPGGHGEDGDISAH